MLYIVVPVLAIPIKAVLGEIDTLSNNSSGLDEWEAMMLMVFHSEDVQKEPLFASSAVAGALFGAIHCFAWNFTFASHVEHAIWRIASLTVIGSCLAGILGLLLLSIIMRGGKDVPTGAVELVSFAFSFIFFMSFMIFYPISRICLLVLALTSLRSLPPSAFGTIRWIELIPHV